MVEYNGTRVYREDWGFKMAATEDFYSSNNLYIKNDGVHNYIEVEDLGLCRDFDDALYKLGLEVLDLLADRVYFEHDVNNEVLGAFTKAINDAWVGREHLGDVYDIAKRVNSGRYDDEMNKYYAYLQAEATLENLDLFEFGLGDTDEIVIMLNRSSITIYEDELEFCMPCVIESVERTGDLEADVTNLLEKVIDSLKDAGETINFAKGY